MYYGGEKKQGTDLKKWLNKPTASDSQKGSFFLTASMHLYYANHSQPNAFYYNNNCSLLQ